MIARLIIKKAIKGGFEAINQHDLPRLISSYQDDATLIYPGEGPQSGTFKGKAAVEGWYRTWFDQFPSIHLDLKDIYVKSIFGLRTNSVVTHWDIQLTNRDGVEGTFSGVTLFDVKGGKVLLQKEFLFDQGEHHKRMWGVV